MFTLGICTWKDSNEIESGYTLVPTSNQPDIQEYFLQIARQFKDFDVSINDQLARRVQRCLKGRFHRIQKQQLRIISRYLNEIQPLLKLLAENSQQPNVKDRISLALHESTNDLIENLEELRRKIRLIDELQRDHFEYYNVFDPLDRKMNEQTVKDRLIDHYPHCRILCSNDRLNDKYPSKFHQFRRDLSKENTRLIYADFSDCSFQLSDMKILSSLPQSNEDDVINILLLGETGVGKSTFINAFVNYLTFDTFQQAEINQPVALIPVSFLLTIGDQFDERLIQFGGSDQSGNEDFTRPGQSVTQQCKSHRFDLRRDIGKKLCIIDTPGFGDTRGIHQDDINMENIIQYVNTLTHLNAICVLLQPNVSRLNPFYGMCLNQLLDRFGWDLSSNVLFAFTNCRSTGYTPGDTAPLLRRMLESLPEKKIRLSKENSYCFDSEAFRYLISLQNGIQFDQVEKSEYEISWKTSVRESNRLLTFIRTRLNPYSLHRDEQSMKNIQMQIVQMIRPMLETMRNILRNVLLIEKKHSNVFIRLNARSLTRPTSFCTICKRDPFYLGEFWIFPDDPHRIGEECEKCECDVDQHMMIDYILSYEISKDRSLFNLNEMKKIFNELCQTSAQFAWFLIDEIHSTNEDPFLLGLLHLIEEERLICTEMKERKELNQELFNQLKRLIENYQNHLENIRKNFKDFNWKNISQQIQKIQQIPMINEQINVIKTTQNTFIS